MDCSPPGFSVQGISQASVLEWVAISFSRGSSQPRDQTNPSLLLCRQMHYHLSHQGTLKQQKVLLKKIWLLLTFPAVYSKWSTNIHMKNTPVAIVIVTIYRMCNNTLLSSHKSLQYYCKVRIILIFLHIIYFRQQWSEFSKMEETSTQILVPKPMNFLPLWAASLCTFRYYFRVTNRKLKSNHCINISDVLDAI